MEHAAERELGKHEVGREPGEVEHQRLDAELPRARAVELSLDDRQVAKVDVAAPPVGAATEAVGDNEDVSSAADLAEVVGSVGLGSLAALHLAWAAGVTWPAADKSALAELVAGKRQMPGPGPCLAVAAALGAASAVVAGVGGHRRMAQASRTAIAGGFFLRGAMGLTATTGRVVAWTPGPRFVRLDRRYYGPLCLGIGLAVATSIAGPTAIRAGLNPTEAERPCVRCARQ